jgi:hypothetical protein
MGSPATKALTLAAFLTTPAIGQEAGWHYSPLPGEGDRATLGCDRDATPDDFACLAVRCEDDFSVGVYVHSSRPADVGLWEMTLDRESDVFTAEPTDAPYGARFVQDAPWLRERIEQGTFIYLRHADDEEGPFRFIELSGSLHAVNTALQWCAPRVSTPLGEPNSAPGVSGGQSRALENDNGPPPARTQ